MFVIGFLNDKVSRLLDAHINSEIFQPLICSRGRWSLIDFLFGVRNCMRMMRDAKVRVYM